MIIYIFFIIQFRIAALNDSSSDSDSGSENGVAAPITKEAQVRADG